MQATPSGDVNPAITAAALPLLRKNVAVFECSLRGGSMEPTIPAGAEIRIRCAEPDSMREQDVIAFLSGSEIMVHRLWYRGRSLRASRFVVARGDRCLFPDAPIDIASIIGVVEGYRTTGEWQPPVPPSRRRGFGRWVREIAFVSVAAMLEVSVGAARILTGALWRTGATVKLLRALR
jgi:hypothetical protein